MGGNFGTGIISGEVVLLYRVAAALGCKEPVQLRLKALLIF